MQNMFISLRRIKQFLLLAACVFFALFNYFTYAKAENSKNNSSKTCDKSVDSDCDGLTNTEEKLYGTNPNNADSDSDGYSDGVEVSSGYDPLKPAPGDRIVTGSNINTKSNQNTTQTNNTASQTDSFSQNLASFIAAKGDKPISTTDINTFVDEQLAQNMGAPITLASLPEIDRTQIKILKQDYSKLSDADRKQKESVDAENYLQKMAYLLISNAPVPILTSDDFSAFQQDFVSHLYNTSNTTADLEYFSDLANRLELFLNQVNEVEVPETMIELHVKFLRLAKGLLVLRDSSQFNPSDPIKQLPMLSKLNTFVSLYSDFLQNDVTNYFNQLQ